MSSKPKINRRSWIKLGLAGAAASVISGACDSPSEGASSAVSDSSCSVSPRQELGPFPPMKAINQPDHDVDLTQIDGQDQQATGEIIVVKGRILDLNCQPIAGAVVMVWQSNHHGKYHHEMDLSDYEVDPYFQGWGQAITNEDGEYSFKTIKPGLYTGRTRHIHYKVSKRGYHELVTQLYFEGESQNEEDVLLNQLTHQDQQQLITTFPLEDGIPTGTFDIYLEAVSEGSVSPEVLAEYSGEYRFDLSADHMMRDWMKEIGVEEEDIMATVSSNNRQLFLQITSTPQAEIFWQKKDTFNGIAMYSSTITFGRGENGEVQSLSMAMNWSPEDIVTITARKISI